MSYRSYLRDSIDDAISYSIKQRLEQNSDKAFGNDCHKGV